MKLYFTYYVYICVLQKKAARNEESFKYYMHQYSKDLNSEMHEVD